MTAAVVASYVLALGLEPLDALRGGRLPHPVRFDVEGPGGWAPRRRDASFRAQIRPGPRRSRDLREAARIDPRRPQVDRHDSGRYALLYQNGLGDHVDLRIYDHYRRYVPRRLRVPLLPEAAASAAPPAQRIRRPVLFPGAAHPVSERCAGLRGRVLRDGAPLRWARIDAQLPGTGAVVGRAQGDERGEFLLLIDPQAAPFGDLAEPLEVRVSISGPAEAPEPADPGVPARDPYWDLPLEAVPAPGAPDPVSSGEDVPEGYVTSPAASRLVPFALDRILTGAEVAPFEFPSAP